MFSNILCTLAVCVTAYRDDNNNVYHTTNARLGETIFLVCTKVYNLTDVSNKTLLAFNSVTIGTLKH